MSSSPTLEHSSPSATTPSSPALRAPQDQYANFTSSTPNSIGKSHKPLHVVLPGAPVTPPIQGEATLTPPPRSPAAGDAARAHHPPDGTSSDKSSETAVPAVGGGGGGAPALSRKESYKAQRQHYRREKKRATSALLHSIEEPSVVVLADWLKVRGSLKSWTKLWCVLKPGLLLLYKSSKAKSNHWVGTVILTSCQVIERPSKKDGFCFKLYHPLEQSIWAPRGPHNESIGAVVQPLPTAHLIFRAPSQAAGHCWLDGLELALKCSNAMLRCSRSRSGVASSVAVTDTVDAAATQVSHEDLEKHFHDHVAKISHVYACSSPTPLISVADYSPRSARHSSNERKGPSYTITKKLRTRVRKLSKWEQLVDSAEKIPKDDVSSEQPTPQSEKSFPDFNFFKLKRQPFSHRNTPQTSSMRDDWSGTIVKDISLVSTPVMKIKEKMESKTTMSKYFDITKLLLNSDRTKHQEKNLTPTSFIEDMTKLMSVFPKLRSLTPNQSFPQKRISELRSSRAKIDSVSENLSLKSENTSDVLETFAKKPSVVYENPKPCIITKTTPSMERFLTSEYNSSSTDDIGKGKLAVDLGRHSVMGYMCEGFTTPDKYSLIDFLKMPSANLSTARDQSTDERFSSQRIYQAGRIVTGSNELEGLGLTDSESSVSGAAMVDAAPPDAQRRMSDALRHLHHFYVEDAEDVVGPSGELVEEIAEENKSLLWFLVKQVRPGMDLSKVVLPTFILEPRSFLDKLSDNYYHADILASVCGYDDPYQRFKTVLKWYLSGLYRKPKGLKKPYNPVRGELFRCFWYHPDTDTRTYYIAEQVSHHPPISAFYVSNRKDGFIIEGSLLARSKFYGNSTSAILEGSARIILVNRGGEIYITSAPYAHCKGLVVGTLSMELGGKVHVSCPTTGYYAEIDFKLKSFLGGADQTNAISGRIKRGRDTVATLEGYWDGRIDIKDKRSGEESVLLDCSVLRDQRLRRSVVRPDRMQEFESGRLWAGVSRAIMAEDQTAATEEKTLVEQAQRERAKQAAVWTPQLFHKDERLLQVEGVVDQGYRYNHLNAEAWSEEEVVEYEEEFRVKVARTRRSDETPGTPVPTLSLPRQPAAPSDSDSHDDVTRRSKHYSRNLRKTLNAIDSSLREQSHAVERLRSAVEVLGQERRPTVRPPQAGRSHSWDLFAGFVLALVLQAVLNWLFFRKD